MREDDEDEDVDPNMLKDGERLRIPMRMADATSRSVRGRIEQQLLLRDSPAYDRPQRGPLVTDQFGGTLGLHKPGPRIETGGNIGDGWVRDGDRDETRRARADYEGWLCDAWRESGPWDDLIAERERVPNIPNVLIGRSGETRAVARDHRERVARVLESYDRELSNGWRANK